jgi:hypothetical protein
LAWISETEFEIDLPTPLAFKERVTASFLAGTADAFQVTARIQLIKAKSACLFAVRGSFDVPLDSALLLRPYFANHLDRRRATRSKANLSAGIRFHESQAEIPAYVVDVSDDGCCLWLAQLLANSDQIVVRFQDDVKHLYVHSTVIWVEPSEGGYLVGCSFNRDG